MLTDVTLPGGSTVRTGSAHERTGKQPDWGVYADDAWSNWPGIVLDWPDFGLPADHETAFDAIKQAFARARQGQDVVIGCRGGTGRTGAMLACLAILGGVPPELAVPWVRKRYRAGAVETPEQARWVTETFTQLDWVGQEADRSRDSFINARTRELRDAMRRALELPERSPILAWAIPDVLAITQRPLRAHPLYGGSRRDCPAEARPAIDEWLSRLMDYEHIRSLIVLTSNKELAHYDAPTSEEGGLLALYKERGLAVEHFPADDPAHDVRAMHAFYAAVDTIAGRVAEVVERLPHPAVMHCSAAIDRSPPVAARVELLHEVDAIAVEP